ncbi:AAA family ATPase [Microcoleus sp. LEGE 07076]|uniref:McrB family protein n=1 Tax=Microcoleus sp. LEGE 07076 TaxID=915322 RepID=UPI00187DEC0E|nr:AAA family ATPase [Microcoleus sp. LEGE 07076]MBE9186557.1 AAA family ATPase [Microcoleus sp. LEGE 07076]
MEKVFVHPECAFSAETFNLLEKFYEDPSSDFYIAHKKDFLKYVEEPLNYISRQVEEQLPDFIKEYIHIKQEGFASIFPELGDWEPTAYSIVFNLKNIISTMDCISSAQLILNLENQKITFGFYSGSNDFEAVEEYRLQPYIIDENIIELLKRYNLPNNYSCSLIREKTDFQLDNLEFNSTSEPANNVYEILENIMSYSPPAIPPGIKIKLTKFQVQISLELQDVLGYSANNLIRKIGQAFKKLFPLFLIFNFYDDNNYFTPLVLSEYFLVYEKEFNPVYQLEEISEITGFQTTQLTQWIHAIHRKAQAIIQGPPGTGKTFIAEKLAKHLIGGGDGFSDIIQFHPAYTYEDFIEGLRPITQNGQLTYSIVPGRFLEFCEKAEACEDICVLIIDEINRANLSQVFGELMYLLDDRPDTERFITLASGKQFRIPTNVRIIGTMNTADRSIALVDNALRRRFAFISIYPNSEVLRVYHHREETGFPVDKLTSILKDVNRAINNKHYELGISFFLTKTLAEDIQDIWQMEIEPYLEEYFFDNQAKMDEFLWNKIKDKLSK